jgi:hypothetical protein
VQLSQIHIVEESLCRRSPSKCGCCDVFELRCVELSEGGDVAGDEGGAVVIWHFGVAVTDG